MKSIILVCCSISIIIGLFMTIVSQKQQVDLIVTNGTIYTVDKYFTIAQAMAVNGSMIVAVGSHEDIQNRYTSQNVIDLKGKTVIPGLIDAHAHVFGVGRSVTELNLVGTRSSQEIVQLVTQRAKELPPGEWIRGRGWDQNDWEAGAGFPTAAILDKATTQHPVILSRIDGHAVWVNSKAMELAGVKNSVPVQVIGGKIINDERGIPTGIFVDNAIDVIRTIVPRYTYADLQRIYRRAFEECVRYGVTTVHDMGIDEEEFSVLHQFASSNLLPLRIYAAIDGKNALYDRLMETGPFRDGAQSFLTVRALKLYADGALGSRGAALFEPYSDDPDNRGLELTSIDTLRLVAEKAFDNGFQISIHAIGDRGNHTVLDLYEELYTKNPIKLKASRLRVEHVQVLNKEDLPRFKQLNVIPSMQPTHCTSDMYWVQARLGPERVRNAYAWRSLLDDGNIIASGSDAPVEQINPLNGIYAAITRQDSEGIPQTAKDVAKRYQLSPDGIRDSSNFEGGWYPQQRMTREEALRSFTAWAAYAEFAENQKGSLETGKFADFVILSKDIMTIPPREILSTVVERTFVAGKVAYTIGP